MKKKHPWRNEKENKNKKNLNKKLATVWPTTPQPSLVPKSHWVQPTAIESKLHVGNKCVVVEHTAETIFIYASKTLDAELD